MYLSPYERQPFQPLYEIHGMCRYWVNGELERWVAEALQFVYDKTKWSIRRGLPVAQECQILFIALNHSC